MLFPSWPSLVFLLWACAIWLIPKVNPALSLLYTSPALVLYSLSLLVVQYVYSLDVGDGLLRNIDVVRVCNSGREEGCKSLTLLGQVRGG